MLKFFLTFLLACIILTGVQAQTIIKSRVLEKDTRIVLPNIRVVDMNNKQATFTGEDGKFAIKARVGDKLILSGFSYETDTVLVTSVREREIFLLPKGTLLSGVTVTSSAVAVSPEAFKINPTETHTNKTIGYTTDENGNYKGGVTLKLFEDNPAERKRQLEAKLEADDRARAKIATAFNAKTVAQYVPLKGKDLDDFVALYIPDIKTYMEKDFNMAQYVSACYKKFIKLPPEKRHPEKLGN